MVKLYLQLYFEYSKEKFWYLGVAFADFQDFCDKNGLEIYALIVGFLRFSRL